LSRQALYERQFYENPLKKLETGWKKYNSGASCPAKKIN